MIDHDALDRTADELSAALISDACDRLGIHGRVLTPGIRPLSPHAILCGIAQVIHAEATGWEPISPYARQIEALDAIVPDSIVVSTVGGDPDCALWGELFSTAARARGARGVVVDGYVRDAAKIVDMGFAAFVRGYSPADSYGRLEVVPGVNTVRVGSVEIRSGDLIFGDVDGIVAVPREIAEDVLRVAFEKSRAEGSMRDDLRRGDTLRQAFDRHRVL